MAESHSQKERLENLNEKMRELFEQKTQALIEAGMEDIDEMNKFPCHNFRRVQAVRVRNHKILEALSDSGALLTERIVRLGDIAAVYQDYKLIFENEIQDGILTRRRLVRESKEESEEILERFVKVIIEEANERNEGDVFSEDDVRLVRNAILATITTEVFPGSKNSRIVYQPNLTEDLSPVAFTLALADLSYAGMENFPDVLYESQSLFLETYPGITDMVEDYHRRNEPLPIEMKKKFRQLILDWYESEWKFLKDRKLRFFEKEITLLPDYAQKRIKKGLFNQTNFNLNIDGMQMHYVMRRDMPFDNLYRELETRDELLRRSSREQ